MSEMVPAQFKIGPGGQYDVIMSCGREDCWWQTSIAHAPLTEAVALAREHMEGTHCG